MNRRRFLINGWILLIALLAFQQIRAGGLSPSYLMAKILMLPGIITGIAFHEWAHAFSSDRLGDPTPRRQGRLTLNPMAHIDPIGFLCLILIGFGWGIPVPIDPTYYKNKRRDEAIVSLSGVTTNFLLAAIFLLIIKAIATIQPGFTASDSMGGIVVDMLQYGAWINIVLMVFNLIPLPPLDGFGLLTQIFNLRKYHWYYTIMRYGNLFLMALIFLGGSHYILTPAVQAIYGFLTRLILG